ncbi:hypothetical protein [Nonomuraea harbinensis]|uniref:Tetracyclin repressor-like C-terminal domain-containing protein n=1 Tax=Nonomuraea harbinensis TaxID=1286938 RepID=A0ABW1C1U5_9ACTN|nr:hypothetical protein [Nonomuraea harbinensis]
MNEGRFRRAQQDGVVAADADLDVLIDLMAGAVTYRDPQPDPPTPPRCCATSPPGRHRRPRVDGTTSPTSLRDDGDLT